MTLEPTATREFAPYLHHFEMEALGPLLLGITVSLALSGLWLAVLMCHLRHRIKEAKELAGHR